MKTIRQVSLGLALSAWLFLGLASTAMAQPPIPHTLTGRDDCLACHGPQGVEPVPLNHAARTNDTCRACHKPGAGTVGTPTVAATPSVRPTPPTLGTRIPLAPGSTESSCATCHRGLGGSAGEVVKAWEESRHRTAGAVCSACHGGDPNAATKEAAMSVAAGYVGIPTRQSIPDLCGSCHSDPGRMRQYNLPTDQLAEYRSSRHGQLLSAGDTNVATCVDCHGGHAIRQASDPQSTVYPMNVPATCGTCHSSPDRMKRYGIPTDQYSQYFVSVHGVTLLQRQDPRSPTCASCHGNHGTLPPGVSEVANICGQCHSATQELYLQGKHSGGASGSGAPRCITCHGQHDVAQPDDGLLLGSAPRHCGSCHGAGSPQAAAVAEIGSGIAAASNALQAARQDVIEAEGGHLLVVAAEADLAAANTALVQARAAQHAVNAALVKQYTDTSAQISAKVRQAAAKSIAETENRRLLMFGVLAFAAVVAGLLAYAKRLMDAGLR